MSLLENIKDVFTKDSTFRFDSVEEAIETIKKGGMVIVADDESRENEGDLICAAEFATPENVNFMITEAKGVLCAPISRERAKKLGLDFMVKNNTDVKGTAFYAKCGCRPQIRCYNRCFGLRPFYNLKINC